MCAASQDRHFFTVGRADAGTLQHPQPRKVRDAQYHGLNSHDVDRWQAFCPPTPPMRGMALLACHSASVGPVCCQSGKFCPYPRQSQPCVIKFSFSSGAHPQWTTAARPDLRMGACVRLVASSPDLTGSRTGCDLPWRWDRWSQEGREATTKPLVTAILTGTMLRQDVADKSLDADIGTCPNRKVLSNILNLEVRRGHNRSQHFIVCFLRHISMNPGKLQPFLFEAHIARLVGPSA